MQRPLSAALGAALLAVALLLSPAAPALGPSFELRIVGFDPGVAPSLAALEGLGARGVRVDEWLGFAVVAAPLGLGFDAAAAALPGVAYVEADAPMELFAVGEDELQSQQWGLVAVRAPQAWALLPPGSDKVEVAVLDTGADWIHPDLGPAVWNGNNVHGDDLTQYASAAHCALTGLKVASCHYLQQPPEEVAGPMDYHGHGTHVAGIVGAVRDGQGMAGVAPASLRVVKVLPTGNSAFASIDVVASGIALAAQEGSRVISLSLGCYCKSETLERAVDFAWGAGSLVVAAAGNGDSEVQAYPAAIPAALSVAATNAAGDRWVMAPGIGSSYGSTIDVSAPGAMVLSAQARWTASYGFYWVGLGHKTMSGTSMAAPHVAGVAALVWAANPDLTNVEVRAILEDTARDLGAPGKDIYFGTGQVDAEAAVRAALAAT